MSYGITSFSGLRESDTAELKYMQKLLRSTMVENLLFEYKTLNDANIRTIGKIYTDGPTRVPTASLTTDGATGCQSAVSDGATGCQSAVSDGATGCQSAVSDGATGCQSAVSDGATGCQSAVSDGATGCQSAISDGATGCQAPVTTDGATGCEADLTTAGATGCQATTARESPVDPIVSSTYNFLIAAIESKGLTL